MTAFVNREEFSRAVGKATRAQRLESRPSYSLTSDGAQEEAFRAGNLKPSDDFLRSWESWARVVGSATAAGGGYERVRIVANAPTPYQQFALWYSQFSTKAGERVLYMDHSAAVATCLPDLDFWLLDRTTVLVLHFAFDDALLGASVVTDFDAVTRYRQWIDAAVEAAVPHDEFLAADASRGRPAPS